MNAHAPLALDVKLAQEVAEAIRAAGIAADDPDFLALVEAESELPGRLARMLRRARHVEAQADALGGMIADMRERKARLEQQAEKLRQIATWAMAECGLPRVEAPDFTATVSRARPAVVIPEPGTVPDIYCRIVREPDKVKIREALEDGTALAFAHLGNPGHRITVRTR
jgi:hypothetical protein